MEQKIAKQKKRYEADQKAHNEKLEDQRIKQEAEISNLKTSGELLEKKYSSYQELDEIEQRVIRAEEEDRSLRHSLGRMERAVKEQQDLLATPDKLAKSLVQVHTVMESLGYSQYTGNRATQASKNTYVPAQTAEFKNKPSPADIVVTLTDRMNNSYGKQLSTVEVANLLICTQQHIMTVIKGRPGVGKTSSVIKLAQALGIKNSTAHGDFLNVPVARGWSSSRDILGYYNSLRGEYQASKTGIYEFLRNGEEETAINGRIILLDEGNLSPLEYYLSDFIGICDAEGADRPIITGSPIAGEEYLYPNKNKSLRFMITINSDATVEPLSPRMLDRCPVISMDVSTQENIDGGLLTFDGAISNELLELSFGRVDYDEIETDNALSMIQSFIKSGTDIARQLSSCLYVDGRRENNIKQYLAAAARVFENEKLARDFAVAQFVLPHLNCHGQGALDAMTAMRAFAEVNEWGRCMELLDMVITNGDSYMEHYSFL
jgi:hypothetical protein